MTGHVTTVGVARGNGGAVVVADTAVGATMANATKRETGSKAIAGESDAGDTLNAKLTDGLTGTVCGMVSPNVAYVFILMEAWVYVVQGCVDTLWCDN